MARFYKPSANAMYTSRRLQKWVRLTTVVAKLPEGDFGCAAGPRSEERAVFCRSGDGSGRNAEVAGIESTVRHLLLTAQLRDCPPFSSNNLRTI